MSQTRTILGLIGSPRRGGNTDRIVARLLQSAESAGASTELLRISEYEILPCQGCLACYPGGLPVCAVLKDQMPELVDAMKRADTWVLGTPVYCYGPTGPFKTFMDRWIALLPEVYTSTRAATVIPLHVSAAGAEPTLAMIKTTLRSFGIDYAGDLVCPDLLHASDLNRHPEYLDQAAALGAQLATGDPSAHEPTERTRNDD